MTPKMVQCSCGKWYYWYNMTVADQSACPDCMAERRKQADSFEKPEPYDMHPGRRHKPYRCCIPHVSDSLKVWI